MEVPWNPMGKNFMRMIPSETFANYAQQLLVYWVARRGISIARV